MADTEDLSEQDKNHGRCPYLGLKKDLGTISDFPSSFNFCHRSKPKRIPSLIHQKKVCLTDQHKQCPLFTKEEMKSLPGKLSSPALNILEKPLKYYVFVAGALILLLLIIFISGTIKKRTSQHEINQILTEQSMQMIAQTTNNIQRTRDVSAYTPTQTFSFFTLTPTHTPTPTLTPTPLITDTPTPTATSTQACEYTLVFRLIAVLNTNTLQLTYDTPIYLTPYLMENSTFKDQLDIPGFIVRLNGRETTNYKIFMREPLMPTVLYLQIQALPGDTVEIEIIPPGPRLCSLPYVVIDYNNVPTNTGVNTAVPTPTTTE